MCIILFADFTGFAVLGDVPILLTGISINDESGRRSEKGAYFRKHIYSNFRWRC